MQNTLSPALKRSMTVKKPLLQGEKRKNLPIFGRQTIVTRLMKRILPLLLIIAVLGVALWIVMHDSPKNSPDGKAENLVGSSEEADAEMITYLVANEWTNCDEYEDSDCATFRFTAEKRFHSIHFREDNSEPKERKGTFRAQRGKVFLSSDEGWRDTLTWNAESLTLTSGRDEYVCSESYNTISYIAKLSDHYYNLPWEDDAREHKLLHVVRDGEGRATGVEITLHEGMTRTEFFDRYPNGLTSPTRIIKLSVRGRNTLYDAAGRLAATIENGEPPCFFSLTGETPEWYLGGYNCQ